MDGLFGGPDPTQALARATDWAATPLGPVAQWPGELCAAIRTVLPARVPMLLWWGPELVQIYNDAYTPVLGTKHPRAMGQRAAECWPEIWDVCGPMADDVMSGRGATYAEDQLLFMERHGYREETYWTFSYSPVEAADGGIAGAFVATTDVTSRVLTDRRLRTLRELGGVRVAQPRDGGDVAVEACRSAVAVLEGARIDTPFALAYLVSAPGEEAHVRLAASCGVTRAPETLYTAPGDDLDQAITRVAESGTAETVSGLRDRLSPVFVPGGLPDDGVPDTAVVLPLTTSGRSGPMGVLVLGVSPYRALDDQYRLFFDVAAGHVAITVADALAYQAERRRAEALAELDAAKTRFFQNVSHEFRTPLTLLLDPLRSLLHDPGLELPAGQQEALGAAHRAALRLRRLVDTLLEVARADAVRLRAEPEPTDLPALTADCAAMFRSAAERAGLRLEVDVPPLPRPVPVDREMWVKIVLNLLSNAVKFTLDGTVTVRLRAVGDRAELTVADTGAGIPAAELPRVFERFHQVSGTPGRSREGSGIGLSLVADLVRALDGEVHATSSPGEGSTFTVRVPLGPRAGAAEPLPLPPITDAAVPYVEEALSWTAEVAPEPAPAHGPGEDPPRVLLIEDNPDMRGYLIRLLAGQGWRVDSAGDGTAALAQARANPPDLVLSDVMLPGPDGIAVLRELRADAVLARTPVILLTARAGSESAVEGLRHGADDYVVKPFSPDELLARVRVHLEMTRLRELLIAAGERRAADLEGALDSRSLIGQAIGIVMAQRRCDPDAAFALLTRASQQRNIKLRELARELVQKISAAATTERVHRAAPARRPAPPPPPAAGAGDP